jgi:hypothetical protein
MHFGFPHLIQHNFDFCVWRARARMLASAHSLCGYLDGSGVAFSSSSSHCCYVPYSFVVDTNQKTVRMNHSKVKRTHTHTLNDFVSFYFYKCTQTHSHTQTYKYKYCVCPIPIHNFIIHLKHHRQYCIIIIIICCVCALLLRLYGHWTYSFF